MKAALLREFGQALSIEEVQLADPIGHEVRVDVKACGLCHSDLLVIEGGHPIPLPAVLGHEVSGIVSAIGPDVTSISVGDHVVGCLLGHCGHCNQCLSGSTARCLNRAETRRSPSDPPRVTQDGAPVFQLTDLGGLAEQILTHESNVVTIPDDVPLDRAALLGCGAITGAGAVINTAGIRFGDTVAVVGCGGVGLSALQAAALSGARRVIAVDVQPAKLELARRFGATDTINSLEEDLAERIRSLTDGQGVDVAFEVAGLKATAQQAIQITRQGGRTYMVGMQRPSTSIELDGQRDFLFGQKTVVGVYMGSSNFKLDIPLLADFYRQGRFNLDDLVSQTIGLDEVNEGFEELKSGRTARSVVVF